MKKSMFGMIVVFGLVLSFSVMVFAVDPPTVTNTLVKRDFTILKTADLRVNMIEAWPCACELDAAAVDAMIVKGNIVVRVQNAGPFATDARITLKVFNYRSNMELGFAKAIHLENNQFENVVLAAISSTSPFLIKKSYGIRAEIVVTSAGVTDPNTSNNTKTINICQYTID